MDVGKQLHTPAHNFTACNSCHTLEIDVFETKIEESEYIYIQEDCEGWWLSGCRSSVAEHWLHETGVLGSIPGDCQPFHFLLFSPQKHLISHHNSHGLITLAVSHQ